MTWFDSTVLYQQRVGQWQTACLQGEGCRFEPELVHADVAQREEASRSDRDQCRFDSCRQYQLDVAQRERTGVGGRGLEVLSIQLGSRPETRGVRAGPSCIDPPARRNARW